MKNHLGSYECKLCLTLHNNEVSANCFADCLAIAHWLVYVSLQACTFLKSFNLTASMSQI